jgi:hypothetical protein
VALHRPINLASRQRIGAATALVFLANLVAVGWHEARTQHARCAEHGEMVDVTEVAAAEPGAAPSAQDGLKAAPPGAPGTDDDHCSLCASAIGAATTKQRIAELSATHLVELVATAADEPFRPIALLHVAPKGSPPVRA